MIKSNANDQGPLRVGYLVGTGHCGSTPLALLLDSHPRIASLGEIPSRKVRRRGGDGMVCTCGELLSQCKFWASLSQDLAASGLRFSVQDWTNDYRYLNPILNRFLGQPTAIRPLRAFQLWATARLPVHRDRVRRAHAVNVAMMRIVLSDKGAEAYIDKSKHMLRLEHLRGVPELDVRVIRLYRDARAHVAWAKENGIAPRAAATYWTKTERFISESLAALSADRICELRYEDLCADPVAAVDKVSDFLDVPRAVVPEVVDPARHHLIGNGMRLGGPFTLKADESWRTKLSGDELALVGRIAGRLNAEYGYQD